MNVFERLERGFDRAVERGRWRSHAFDRFWRAKERYDEVMGGRLAAAIAYYGFFAVFALALIGYAVFGFVLERNPEIQQAVVDFFAQSIPWLQIDKIQQAVEGIQATGGPIGVVGILGLAFTGIGWVESLRSSQRAFYRLNQQPGNIIFRTGIDVLVVLGVFLLLAISVAAVDLLKSLLFWLAGGPAGWLTVLSAILTVPVNMVVAVALLGAIPRLRIPPRRFLTPVMVAAIGFTLLNSVGRYYIQRIDNNPAYAVVATAVGLLVYLYIFNLILMWSAAFLATDERHGGVTDLAADPPPEVAPGPGPPAALPADHAATPPPHPDDPSDPPDTQEPQEAQEISAPPEPSEPPKPSEPPPRDQPPPLAQ